MRDLNLYVFVGFGKIVRLFLGYFLGKDMGKYFGAKNLQQFVLRFEVRVECTASYIRLIDYVLYRNTGIILLFQQTGKSVKNGLPCFLLSSVHCDPPEQITYYCSVMNFCA